MAEHDKEIEKADAKVDADAGEKLDKVLAHLDSVMQAADALSSRMDAYEAERKKEEESKADEGEEEPEMEKKADEGEEEKEEDKADEGEEEDKADEGEEEPEMEDIKARELAADYDATVKAKKDAEREEERRADSEDIRRRIADVERRLPRQMSDADFAAMADTQARADAVFSAFGKRAPRPLDGETLPRYRRRLASALKAHSPEWQDVNLTAMVDNTAFDVIEKRIYADALHAANHPTDVEAGDLREITTVNPTTGQRMTRFAGKSTFIVGMKSPVRRVVGLGLANLRS